MATIQHADLRGEQVHEPKNIEIARNGEVYVATGDGTGAWRKMEISEMGGYTPYSDGLLTRKGNNVTTSQIGRVYGVITGNSPLDLEPETSKTLDLTNMTITLNSNLTTVADNVAFPEQGVYRVDIRAVVEGGEVVEGDNSNLAVLEIVVGGNSSVLCGGSVNNGDTTTLQANKLITASPDTQLYFTINTTKAARLLDYEASIQFIGE